MVALQEPRVTPPPILTSTLTHWGLYTWQAAQKRQTQNPWWAQTTVIVSLIDVVPPWHLPLPPLLHHCYSWAFILKLLTKKIIEEQFTGPQWCKTLVTVIWFWWNYTFISPFKFKFCRMTFLFRSHFSCVKGSLPGSAIKIFSVAFSCLPLVAIENMSKSFHNISHRNNRPDKLPKKIHFQFGSFDSN